MFFNIGLSSSPFFKEAIATAVFNTEVRLQMSIDASYSLHIDAYGLLTNHNKSPLVEVRYTDKLFTIPQKRFSVLVFIHIKTVYIFSTLY